MGDEGRSDPALAPAGATEAVGKKRPRSASGSGGELKRVAEIVMVLSAMGEMRGGRDPTAVEKSLVAEARELLAGTCEELKPKDLFSRDAVRAVVEDLGLNRTNDPLQGFRPPKISIADKLLLTKKRQEILGRRQMEESKESATVHSPQPLPIVFGANSESFGTMLHGAPRFLQDRTSPIALSTGGFQSASPVVHVPDQASVTTLMKQSHVNETQPVAAVIKSSTCPPVKDSSLSTLPHAEATHFRLDARPKGPAYITQFRATASAGEYAPVKIPTTSVQTTSATVKLGQDKLLDHTLVKPEGVHEGNSSQSSRQVMRIQGTQTSVIQATPGNLVIGHQPSQALTYVHGTSYFTNHNDIAKTVQRVLQQKVSDHPHWTPSSMEYMNKPLNCQICKITIIDVETLLVCDACEKGTHLNCLKSYVNKGIPKAEWHCPKCLLASNGKPLPPKYGRVSRSIAASKVSSNTVGTYASVGKRSEKPDPKVNNEKLIPNGLPYPEHTSNMASDHSESASDSRATSAGEMQASDFFATEMKREDDMPKGTSSNQSKETDEMLESSDKQVESRGLSPSDMQRSTSTLDLKIVSEQACSMNHNDTSEVTHQFQAPSDSQACNGREVLASVEVSANQLHEISMPSTDELKPCDLRETPKCEGDCDVRQRDHENSQATPNGTSDMGIAATYCGGLSPLDLHTVDWVGNILETVDNKAYYQSCRINGALHKLQDHVLISSNSRDMFPSKIQSLWEDNKTGSKWAVVDPYYFPSDLAEVVNRPSTTEKDEVYASINGSTIMAGTICGTCEVLPIDKFREESDRRARLGDIDSGLHPIFLCKWLYDESKGIFQSVTS